MMNATNPDEFAKELMEYSSQFMSDKEVNSFIADQIRSVNLSKLTGFSEKFFTNLANEIEELE